MFVDVVLLDGQFLFSKLCSPFSRDTMEEESTWVQIATEKGIIDLMVKERLQTEEIEMDIKLVMEHKYMVTRTEKRRKIDTSHGGNRN